MTKKEIVEKYNQLVYDYGKLSLEIIDRQSMLEKLKEAIKEQADTFRKFEKEEAEAAKKEEEAKQAAEALTVVPKDVIDVTKESSEVSEEPKKG